MPKCSASLGGYDDVTGQPTVTCTIAHIHARKESGPRWDGAQTSAENRHFDNLMLMCEPHAREIDRAELLHVYPAATLRKWKAAQVARATRLPSRPPAYVAYLNGIEDAIAATNPTRPRLRTILGRSGLDESLVGSTQSIQSSIHGAVRSAAETDLLDVLVQQAGVASAPFAVLTNQPT